MIDFPKIKLYIFDLQQTLVQDSEQHLESLYRILKEYKVNDVEGIVSQIKERWGMVVSEEFRDLLGKDFSEETILEMTEKKNRYYLEALSRQMPQLLPGALEILTYLKSCGKTVAIASGSHRRSIEKALALLGIGQLVDYYIGCEDVARGKPDPETIIKAWEKSGFSKIETIVIGDSYVDVLSAKDAGIVSIGVATGFTAAERLESSGASLVVSNLNELIELVKSEENKKPPSLAWRLLN